MADIVVKIKTNDGYDKIETFSADKPVNNVSTPTNEETTPNDGVNGKSMALGYVTLLDGYIGGQDTFLISEMNKYNGYMFGATDAEGNYDVGIEIFGVTFDKINIVGDKNANQFPTMAILDEGTEDEKTVYNDDLEFGIAFTKESDSHTVRFLKWNRANYNACFTTMTVFVESLEYNRAYIESLTSSGESNFDPTTINYGVVANSGDLKLLDIDGEIADYIRDGIIDNSNLQIEIVLNGQTIQHHITNNSTYNDRERVLSLSLSNKVSLLDDMIFNGMPYQNSSMKAYDVLKYIMLGIYTETEFEDAMDKDCAVYYDGEERVATIGVYLRNIEIPHPYLKQSTYREAIEKVCDIAMLNFYLDKENKPYFCSARPIAYKEEIDNASVIPSYMQVSELEKDLILKNRYDAVSIMKTSPLINTMENSALSNTEFKVKPVYKTDGAVYNSGTSSLGGITSFARIEPYYITGEFVVMRNSADNLRQLDKMTGSDYTLTMKVEEGTTQLPLSEAQSSTGPIKNKASTYPDSYIKITETSGLSGKIPTLKATSTVSGIGYFEAVINDETNISLTNNPDNTVTATYKILAGVRLFNSVATSTFNTSVASGKYISYMAESVSISILGNVITIDMNNEEDYSTSNVSTSRTIARLDNNELQQDITLVENLKRNILNDYKNGVTNAKITTFCGDFYNKDGQKVINFKDGDIILPNSIVCFENDFDNKGNQKYWRVTKNSFDSTTVENELSLSEISNIVERKYRKVVFSNVVDVYDGDVKIESGQEVLDGTKLRIYFGGSDLIDLRVTGYGSIPDNYTITVCEDTYITVRYYQRTVVEKKFTFPSSTSGTVDVVFDDGYRHLDTDLEIYMDLDNNGNGTMWSISKDTINNFTNISMEQEFFFQGDLMFVGTIITNIGVNRILRISNMDSSYLSKSGLVYCETTYITYAHGQ